MILASPPSYLTADAFVASASGNTNSLIGSMTTDRIQDVLNRASGMADSIMRRSLLAQEVTSYYEGNGRRTLELDESPLLYVRQISFAQPGLGGLTIAPQSLLIDYEAGELQTYAPLLLQSIGYFSEFPRGITFAITLGWGYGYTLAQPAFTTADTGPTLGPGLAPGRYLIAVTARTPWGETTATPVQVSTLTGAINLVISPVLGALGFRVYASSVADPNPPVFVGEVPATTYGGQTVAAVVQVLAPPYNEYPASLPIIDTSARAIPAALVEATRLLAVDILSEDANPANVGIKASGKLQWQSASTRVARVEVLLAPYRYIDVL